MTERSELLAANDPRTCPACGSRGHVRAGARPEIRGLHRRRTCINSECQWRWTTVEIDMDRMKLVFDLEAAFAKVWEKVRAVAPGIKLREVKPPPTFKERDEIDEMAAIATDMRHCQEENG